MVASVERSKGGRRTRNRLVACGGVNSIVTEKPVGWTASGRIEAFCMAGFGKLSQGTPFERRLTPVRSGIAAAHRLADGRRGQIIHGAAPLRRAPSPEAPLETEALYGESVVVYEEQGGWAWAQLERDDYVGYLPIDALGSLAEADHRIAVPRSFAYPGPSIKLPPILALSLGARLQITAREGDFAVDAQGWRIYARHLAPLGATAEDFVAIAERFLDVPYLWGGRTSQGIDCSGLVQAVLAEAGISAPRDSDMMEAWLGAPIAFDESLADLQRGDLVFWKGHVGMMRDAQTLLHANGYFMCVTSEPLRVARERIQDPITAIRRL
jgi:cell wall-associated NlpC family hydrolase